MKNQINLDKPRNISYTFDAIDLIECKLDLLWDEILVKSFKGKMTMKQIFTLIWGGLYADDNNLTIEKVMELVYEYSSIDEVMHEVGKAVGEAMKHIKPPKPTEDSEKN